MGLLELAIKLLPPKYKTAVIVSRPTPADIANGLSTNPMVPKQVKKNAVQPRIGEITIKQNQPRAWKSGLKGFCLGDSLVGPLSTSFPAAYGLRGGSLSNLLGSGIASIG